jgi:hypothetical protein
MDEDAEIRWQEVLDQLASGRVQELRCPYCQGPLRIREDPQKTRIECGSCRRFIEGRFGG